MDYAEVIRSLWIVHMDLPRFGRLVRVAPSSVYVVALEDKENALRLVKSHAPESAKIETIGRASQALLQALQLSLGQFIIADPAVDM